MEIGVDDDVVTTVSGNLVHFLDPRPGEIIIEDIAHALSHQCRFGGHTREFYSVAQHSHLVSWLVADGARGRVREMCLAGLLHDAAEAYVVDIPRPVKRLFPEYKSLADAMTAHIFRLYGLDMKMLDLVKLYDTIALVTEGRDLIDKWAFQTDFGVEPLPTKIHPMPAYEAKRHFLNRFHELYI